MAENVPNEPPTTVHQPLDYGGNEVVLEIAPDVYAFFAHLQPGSIRVQIGENVKAGQVLGLLGNTGNSSAPHLHFQLSESPDVLTANSLPFVIDQYTLLGSVAPESDVTDIQVVGERGSQATTLPLDGTVVDFP
jgi:murein DD-endopeptidase MepM/ murein hydrolase activator NlpD